MLTATKVFQFDCAHMLSGHLGLCKNLHGHTYKLEVSVALIPIKSTLEDTIEIGAEEGMVMDFSNLKTIVKECIVDEFDHAFVYFTQTKDLCENEIARVLQSHGKKIVRVSYRPTAENMARDFFCTLESMLVGYGVKVTSVKVWETPTSVAEVTCR
jgi:6-pyruvoyltetrahydropterin/6-carboxytetrahydropterin synthase